jgi:hypothetical protein
MIDPTAPRTDHDTFDVIDDALTALAERKRLWLTDDLALIHLLACLIEQAERCLPEAVFTARENGASWDDIATLLATSPHEAWLRFELPPVARTPHLRWPRPPGRMSPCLLPTLLSSASVPSSWLGSGPNPSLSWRKTCAFPSRAYGTGWPRPTSTTPATTLRS